MNIKNQNTESRGNDAASTGNLGGRHVAAAVVAVVVLCCVIFAAYTGAQKKVFIQVGEEELQARTFAGDVGELLRENNVQLGADDRVYPVPETPLEDGMTVKVRRAIALTLKVGDKEMQVNTAAETVGDLLKERNIALGEQDIIQPGLQTELASGMTITLDRVTVKTLDEEVPIQFNVVREMDSQISRGITQVVQRGVQGLERRTWEVTYVNGRETERRVVSSQVIKKPVDQVVKVGALQVASRGGQDIRFSRAIDMVATAYTHTGNNTATGIKPRVGIVAVDPSVIPLGTRLYVDGYGHCRAMDVGSKIKGNRIDVFLDTKSDAKRWGVRKVRVYVLE